LRPEADVIAAIDALERDEVDDLVDWQMADSPAARAEHGDPDADPNWWSYRDADGNWRPSRFADGGTLSPPQRVYDPRWLDDGGEIRARTDAFVHDVDRQILYGIDARTRERLDEHRREAIAAQFAPLQPPHERVDAAVAAALSWASRAPVESLQQFPHVHGMAGGVAGDLYAITPAGDRVEPDADGTLRCSVDDMVVMLGGGGSGRNSRGWGMAAGGPHRQWGA
jgi:hypothetical protein